MRNESVKVKKFNKKKKNRTTSTSTSTSTFRVTRRRRNNFNKSNCRKLTKKKAEIPMPLNTKWVLWCHLKTERNWDISTFIKVYEIGTIQEFWQVYNNINCFDNQIFFLMRKGISPIWNTPENKEGGKWNIYVNRKKVIESWIHLSLLAVGETLKIKGKAINGIAIRPKFAQSIIKIMTSSHENKNIWKKEYNHFEINKIFGKNLQTRFESHLDTIERVNNKINK
jgi:hypothetical protein